MIAARIHRRSRARRSWPLLEPRRAPPRLARCEPRRQGCRPLRRPGFARRRCVCASPPVLLGESGAGGGDFSVFDHHVCDLDCFPHSPEVTACPALAVHASGASRFVKPLAAIKPTRRDDKCRRAFNCLGQLQIAAAAFRAPKARARRPLTPHPRLPVRWEGRGAGASVRRWRLFRPHIRGRLTSPNRNHGWSCPGAG